MAEQTTATCDELLRTPNGWERKTGIPARRIRTAIKKGDLVASLCGGSWWRIHPQDFQVVLCLNEYGDFLSDMACGLVGSLGTGASANYSFLDDGTVDIAMFDPAGGTAPDIAGQDKANPTAVLLAFGMLLDHMDRRDLGRPLRQAIFKLIQEGHCTADLGGKLKCSEFAKAVAEKVASELVTG